MKSVRQYLFLAGLCLAISLLFLSCTRCNESVCQECIAWDMDYNEVYYGQVCYVSRKEQRRNRRKAEKAAKKHKGSYACAETIVVSYCNQ